MTYARQILWIDQILRFLQSNCRSRVNYLLGSSATIVADGSVTVKPGTFVRQGVPWNARVVQRVAAWDLNGESPLDPKGVGLEDRTNNYRDGTEGEAWAEGRLYDGKSMSHNFNGLNDAASLCAQSWSPPLPFMTEFAVSVWVKLPDPIANGVIFSALGSINSHGGFYLAIENGQVKFVVEKDASANPLKNEVAYTLTSADVSQALNGRWVMITGVWSTEKRRQQLWINNLLRTENTTGILETYLTQGVSYYIGKKPSGSYFRGRVDEASVYAGMPDQKFIDRLYNPFGTWPTFPGHWD